MAFNAHRVFNGSAENSYLSALTVEKAREDELRGVRDEARRAIRAALSDWSTVVTEAALFEDVAKAKPRLTPKFRMQGSFSYRTLNDPAQESQEIDLDDGMFVPVSYLQDGGGYVHPSLISEGYFEAVQEALRPLCRDRGWDLIVDLPSCIRIRIDAGAHVDMALYAIPDSEFAQLVETSVAKSFDALDRVALAEDVEFSDQIYRQLDPDQIMLAHRDEGWKPSDPRKLDDWFQAALRDHEEQFRRVCRYLKGWRDSNWTKCRLASIALMACTLEAFRAAPDIPKNRDDLRLLDVAERLPDLLRNRIPNPVVEGQYLDEKWDECREEFVEQAQLLYERIDEAVTGTNSKTRALELLTAAFGARVPNDVSLIITDDGPNGGGVTAPSILTMGLLKSTSDDSEVRAVVRKDGDGRYG